VVEGELLREKPKNCGEEGRGKLIPEAFSSIQGGREKKNFRKEGGGETKKGRPRH